MGIHRRRRLPLGRECTENAGWNYSDRCRPHTVVGDSTHADCRLDCGVQECGVGLFSAEAGLPRTAPNRTRSTGRISERDTATVAPAVACTDRTLHDGTHA